MQFRTEYLILVLCLGCGTVPTTDQGKRYPDPDLRVVNAVDYANGTCTFSDEGSALGFQLSDPPTVGFVGPLVADDSLGTWELEMPIVGAFRIEISGEDRTHDMLITESSEPGLLTQRLALDEIHITQRLFYHNADHVLIELNIQNLTKNKIPLDLHWTYPGMSPYFRVFAPNDTASNALHYEPQRINFLPYEHRYLSWTIEVWKGSVDWMISSYLPPKQAVSNAYDRNCARWRVRTAHLREMSDHELGTARIQQLVSQASIPISVSDSLALAIIAPDLTKRTRVSESETQAGCLGQGTASAYLLEQLSGAQAE